jgi:hypothetical protein
VGAWSANAGKSYVIFGKTDTGAIDLSKLGDEPKYTIDYLGDENKPPVPAAMADNSMALVLSCLPNTTYDLPEPVPTIKSSKPSPLTSPALETE